MTLSFLSCSQINVIREMETSLFWYSVKSSDFVQQFKLVTGMNFRCCKSKVWPTIVCLSLGVYLELFQYSKSVKNQFVKNPRSTLIIVNSLRITWNVTNRYPHLTKTIACVCNNYSYKQTVNRLWCLHCGSWFCRLWYFLY